MDIFGFVKVVRYGSTPNGILQVVTVLKQDCVNSTFIIYNDNIINTYFYAPLYIVYQPQLSSQEIRSFYQNYNLIPVAKSTKDFKMYSRLYIPRQRYFLIKYQWLSNFPFPLRRKFFYTYFKGKSMCKGNLIPVI